MKNMIRTDLLVATSAIALCDSIFRRIAEVILMTVLSGLLAIPGIELCTGEPGSAFKCAGMCLIFGGLFCLLAATAAGADALSRCDRLRSLLRDAMNKYSE